MTSNRGVAQEQGESQSPEQTNAVADEVVGINFGMIFIVVIVIILAFGAVMLFVGIRQRNA